MRRWTIALAVTLASVACGTNSDVPLAADGGGYGLGGADCINGPNYTDCPCQQGETKACYTGPAGTEGVGACRGGTQTCQGGGENVVGMFGPCVGEVVPSAGVTCSGHGGGGGEDAAPPTTTCITYSCSRASFATQVMYPITGYPETAAAGDFNGDGKPDLAVTKVPSTGAGPDNTKGLVDVLLNQGNGTFAAPVSYAVGAAPQTVATGDFNGDGKVDLATANNNGQDVSVLLNQGNGTFAPKVEYPTVTPGLAGVLVVADFNGDGRPDLATDSVDPKVGVLLNQGNGTFAATVTFPLTAASGWASGGLAAGDFNGDGRPDLAALLWQYPQPPSAPYLPGAVSVLLNQGNGSFAPPAIYALGPTEDGDLSITAADFNTDGKMDLAVANYDPTSSGNNLVSVLLNKGGGAFGTPSTYPGGELILTMANADFNGDCKPDLLTTTFVQASHGVANVLLNKGSGAFAAPVTYPSGNYTCLDSIAADLNGDGKQDVVVVNNTPSSLSVFLNDCVP